MLLCSDTPNGNEEESSSPVAAPWMQETAVRRKPLRPLPTSLPVQDNVPQHSPPADADCTSMVDHPGGDPETSHRREMLAPEAVHGREVLVPLEAPLRHVPLPPPEPAHNDCLSHIPDELPQRKVLPPLQ